MSPEIDLLVRLLPGLALLGGALFCAGFLLPQTIEYRREARARKKQLRDAVRVGRWIEGGDNVTIRDVENAATIYEQVHNTEIKNGTNPHTAIVSALAAVIAYARKENR